MTAPFDFLAGIPVSPPSALELARLNLERLQDEYSSILRAAEEAGSDGELDYCDQWRDLKRRLKQAISDVAAEESVALSTL